MKESTLKSIDEIFEKSLFRIPDYQRGYAWEEKQLEDFWDDIENLKDGSIHYTGMLTLKKIKDIGQDGRCKNDQWLINKGYSAYYIVDGQQRMTTIIILINELINKLKETKIFNENYLQIVSQKILYKEDGLNRSFIFGYEKDDPSNEFLKTKILERESVTADKFPEETLYTLNLKKAKEYFIKKLGQISQDKQGEIFKKIINLFKFNLYEIDDKLDIFVTFETMNNRGKPLSTLELLKNRLIYLTTLLSKDDYNPIREEINEVWKTVYEYLGKNKSNKLSDDDFLKNHWIMFFGYNRERDKAYEYFLLNEYFTAKNKELNLASIKDYIYSIQKSAKEWFYIHNPEYQGSNYDTEIKEWLLRLNRLGFLFTRPLIMVALINKEDKKIVCDLLKKSERFIFLIFGISHRRSGTENSNIYSMANKLYNKELVLSDIIESMESLITGIGSKKRGLLDMDGFIKYIEENFSQYKEGFYKWTYLKYFLYEYEIFLQKKSKDSLKIKWKDVKKEGSIEHILPQTADKECWIKNFGNFSDYQKYILTHSLGNLVLISPNKNSLLQNDCFEKKKKNEGAGYFNGSYSEIDVNEYEKWTDVEIIDRGSKLLHFLEENWGLVIDQNQKDKLLMKGDIRKQKTLKSNSELSQNNKEYIINNYLDGISKDIIDIYFQIRTFILGLDEKIGEKHTSGSISYHFNKNNFILVLPEKDTNKYQVSKNTARRLG